VRADVKIALVMTASGLGGVEQSLVPYAVALRLAGHQVLAVLSANSPLVEEVLATGVAVHPLISTVLAVGIARALDDELRDVIGGFDTDLVIAFAAAGLPQVRRALGHRLPVLTRCGDMTPNVVRELLKADGIIVTSRAMADLAGGLGAPEGSIALLPNFLAGPAVPHIYRSSGVLRVGAMGRFVGRKGFGDLIAVAARLRAEGLAFDLVIAGDGPLRQDLQDQAHGLGVRVDFPGWIGNADKSAFLAGLDVFVVPSRVEPFGNIQLEALQHGLPLITTATVGGRAVFDGLDAARLVPPQKIDGMADALRDLLTDAEARERLGLSGQALFAARYQAFQAAPVLDAIVTSAHARWQQHGLAT
jgi:glycosyltransferase involved in cell wall biosynthesis